MATFKFRVARLYTYTQDEYFEIEAETYTDARAEALRAVTTDDYAQKYPVDATHDMFANPVIEGNRTLYRTGDSTQEYTQEYPLLVCAPKKPITRKYSTLPPMGYERDMMEPPFDNGAW